MIANPSDPEAAARHFGTVAARYASGDRFTRHYVASKLKRDPVHRDVLEFAASTCLGAVLDLGCGRGQMGILLLEAGRARSVVGYDRNPAHVAQARRAAAGLAFAAEIRDLALPEDLPEADTVLLIDVLYQLAPEAQRDLLRRATLAARHRLLIRTLDPGRGARSAFSGGMERLFRRVWPNAGSHVAPWSIADMVAALAADGFATEEVPCWRGTPFANVLLVARRVPKSQRDVQARITPPPS